MTSPFATLIELAQHFRVSESTIRIWMRTNKVPKGTYVHINQTYRFNLDAVEKALLSDTRKGENISETTWADASPEEVEKEYTPHFNSDEDY
tara:strand:- start:1143 stop:1418 length:276 start_codon:yes stop_codon:yes gene_type:complete